MSNILVAVAVLMAAIAERHSFVRESYNVHSDDFASIGSDHREPLFDNSVRINPFTVAGPSCIIQLNFHS